jgi:hypothetical protein
VPQVDRGVVRPVVRAVVVQLVQQPPYVEEPAERGAVRRPEQQPEHPVPPRVRHREHAAQQRPLVRRQAGSAVQRTAHRVELVDAQQPGRLERGLVGGEVLQRPPHRDGVLQR